MTGIQRTRILHLSDIHLGGGSESWYEGRLCDDLLHYIKDKHKNDFDLIIISGDIVWGNLSKDESEFIGQIAKAENFLNNLATALSISDENLKSKLLICCGNHDLDHKKSTAGNALKTWIAHSTEAEFDKSFEEGDDVWQHAIKKQSEFLEFQKRWCPKIVFNDDNTGTGFAKFEINGVIWGIGVYNTSLLSAALSDEEKGRMYLPPKCYQWVINNIRDASIKASLSHHPLTWLINKDTISALLYADFDVHFFGHEHNGWLESKARGGRHGFVNCSASATKTQRRAVGEHKGFSIVDFYFDNQKPTTVQSLLHTHTGARWQPLVIGGLTDDLGKIDVNLVKDVPKTLPQELPTIPTISCFIRELETKCQFDHIPDAKLGDSQLVVFWPVRVRTPSLIHAIQARAARGLCSRGAKIVLCLDNLGNDIQHGTTVSLENRLKKWVLGNTNPDPRFRVIYLKQESETIPTEHILEKCKEWLIQDEAARVDLYRLLRATKLVGEHDEPNSIIQALSRKHPKKLFGISILSASMTKVIQEASVEGQMAQLLTLGGRDEADFWKAWREVSKEWNQIRVEHLYNPVIYEDEGRQKMIKHGLLYWESKMDVQRTLQDRPVLTKFIEELLLSIESVEPIIPAMFTNRTQVIENIWEWYNG